ncbi:MAG: NusG domain II-containing protein [Clostridiales bacterium]|nr:NusG domain II-containing protein [Clostridiales bacterium]
MTEKRIDVLRKRKLPFGVLDVVVFAAVIVLTVVLLVALNRKVGASVEIAYDGTTVTLPLSRDAERDVGGHLTVVIKDGAAYVRESDCKHQTCVHTGKIKRVGQSIVCAQNGVVITVIGESGLAGTVG